MPNAHETQFRSGIYESTSARRFLACLPAIVSRVAIETTRSAVAARIAREFVIRLGASTARVYLMCPDRLSLHLAAAENVDLDALSPVVVVRLDDDFPASTAARVGVVQLARAGDSTVFGCAPGAGAVALAIPLFARKETIGAVITGFERLHPRQGASLGLLSHSLGALLDRARAHDERERQGARSRASEPRLT